MSRIQNFAFIAFFLLCSVYSKERGVGADCDIWHWCDAGLDCFDYRCAVAVPEKEDGEVEWTPDGTKCDLFHWYPKHFECKNHRCVTTKKTQQLKQAKTQQLKTQQKTNQQTKA